MSVVDLWFFISSYSVIQSCGGSLDFISSYSEIPACKGSPFSNGPVRPVTCTARSLSGEDLWFFISSYSEIQSCGVSLFFIVLTVRSKAVVDPWFFFPVLTV